ncbi:MAG: lipopolysaccharide biosynthesis protein [Odoribacteraceae bacterium]|jgi:O-antigen/teichoic acid export membrane protein|nr:lipopolysaccharide biosynthesis protein [Odoribacteraceae bacterium]
MKSILSRIPGGKNSSPRTREYRKNTILLLCFQAISLVVNLLLVPVVIRALGKEEYGIWVVLVTIVGWLSLFDLGLGHGLRNKYAEAKALGNTDDMKHLVSTAFITLCGLSATLFLLFIIAWPLVPWTAVFACDPALERHLSLLVLVVIASFCLRFIANTCTYLLLADQKPAYSNAITLSGQVLSLLVVTLLVKFSNPGLLTLGAALSLCQLSSFLVAFILLFSGKYRHLRPRPSRFSRPLVRPLFSLGTKFFAIQLTAMIIFASTSVIIAHVSSLENVAEFNIAYKYITILQVAFAAIVAPLWSASTDALARGDMAWIKKAVKNINILWTGAVAAGILMIMLSPLAYKLWLGDTLRPDKPLLALVLTCIAFQLLDMTYRGVMNGAGKIRLQLLVTSIQALLHVPLAIILGRQLGVAGVLVPTILWNIVNCAWEKHQYTLIVNKKPTGICNQ